MFDFSVLTGGDLEERKGDGEEAAAAAAAQVKTPAKPTKPTKKDLKKGWQADSEAAFCVYCNEAFTFLRRRHHCRHCGTVVCDHCSQYAHSHPCSVLLDQLSDCVTCLQVSDRID